MFSTYGPRHSASRNAQPSWFYLDLNHWISLAKAMASHADGRPFEDALAACIDAVGAS